MKNWFGKVLIVEDDEISQLILKNNMNQIGLLCDISKDGNEALEQMKNTSYNFVITDIKLPDFDGFTLAKKVKENSDLYGENKIIGYSSDEVNDVKNGTYLDFFMLKPATKSDWLNLMNTILC